MQMHTRRKLRREKYKSTQAEQSHTDSSQNTHTDGHLKGTNWSSADTHGSASKQTTTVGAEAGGSFFGLFEAKASGSSSWESSSYKSHTDQKGGHAQQSHSDSKMKAEQDSQRTLSAEESRRQDEEGQSIEEQRAAAKETLEHNQFNLKEEKVKLLSRIKI